MHYATLKRESNANVRRAHSVSPRGGIDRGILTSALLPVITTCCVCTLVGWKRYLLFMDIEQALSNPSKPSMPPTIHFYDAQFLGSPSQGQLVSFDSLCYGADGESRYGVQISLRPDVAFQPEVVELLDCFDLNLSDGVTEYEWSRNAQSLFGMHGALHVGIGNTAALDHFIRYALYRCLSTLPNTELPEGAYYLDLLTVCRAIGLLRPSTMPIELPAAWAEQRKRDYIHTVLGCGSRADTVLELARSIHESSPKMMAHAISYASPARIAELCGLVGGQVESLSSLRPVFVCHELLMAEHQWGVFLTLATDPQYSNMVYMVDLQCDLSELVEDAGGCVSRFIRTDSTQTDRPIVRVNLNRIPFVSPLGVIDPATASRLGISPASIKHNATLLYSQRDICLALMEVSGASEMKGDPDYHLFGAEYLEPDRLLLSNLHNSPRSEWSAIVGDANDARIITLADRLIGRLEPALLSVEEAKRWHAHCASRIRGRADSTRIATTKDYCSWIAASNAYPQGVRAAARHWLHTIEIGNEPRNV